MADPGNAILNHYKIDSLFPAEWPSAKDAEDSSDDEGLLPPPKPARVTSKSRYSVLEPKRSSVPGAERTKDGLENLVQRDEPDPLGNSTSVIQTLRRQGVNIDGDSKLRNRYLLSSTTFSPPLFLSQVHHDATTEDLIRGLNFLSQSIEKKSASLKVLVESNFEKFVRAKATIDNVYREMVSPGEGSNGGPPPTTKKAHSRQASRQSMTHLRKTSGSISLAHTEKRKNALVKEQDYGILPIKIPLLELKAKIDEVWGPALGGRERESYLNVLTTSIEKQRSIFEIGGTIAECIKRREHDTLVDEYTKARRLAEDSRILLESASKRNAQLSDQDVLQIVMTARMWSDVEDQIEGFKRDVWRRLAGTHFIKQQIQEENKAEEYVELIKVLLELGVEDNPIWVWLFSRYDYLKQKIVGTFERSKVEIEILRRRLSYGEKPTDAQIALHLRAATSDGRVRSDAAIDSAKVIEVWEHIFSCLNTLLSTQGGILGEILEFWETAQSFIDGKAQRSLPAGIDGRSRKHHRLSTDGVKTISGGAQDLVNTIRDSIQSFFNDLPTEDLSLLLSPIPATPLTPKTPKTPKSATFQSFTDNRLRIDVSNIPPPSPRKGDSWEQYAFWPPHANSLSGVYYLTKILNLVATASCDMAGVKILDEKSKSIDSFKILVGSVRDRCVQAACAAWNSDCERANVLEDWTRALERSDLTNFPSRLMNFEGFLLNNFQKMLYISEATKRPSSPDIITPPPSKLLQMVRNNFVGGLYKVISGMKENAKSESPVDDDSSDGLVTPMPNATAANTPLGLMDSSNKNVRILLTLSNVHGLRHDIMPHLITMCETNFTMKLTDETTAIRDALAKMDARLFQAYVTPLIKETDALIRASISDPEWAPKTNRPTDARPYVYTVLLGLVLVHSEVSTTTSPLTSPILRHLLEKYLISLFEAFKQRQPRYTLWALMQATLDVEFLTQTLNNYTTDKAVTTQSEIYVQLDKLTDNEASVKLQQELFELKVSLKKLREGTKTEFACFKRQRGHTKTGERPAVNPSER